MTTYLDQFSQREREALDLLRTVIRQYAVYGQTLEAIDVGPDPHLLAHAIEQALALVEPNPLALREFARAAFTMFDLAPSQTEKRAAVQDAYHDEATMALFVQVVAAWCTRFAAHLAARDPVSQH